MISHVSFTSVPVEDFARAKVFYTGTLGLKEHTDAPYGPDRGIMLEIPGARTLVQLQTA